MSTRTVAMCTNPIYSIEILWPQTRMNNKLCDGRWYGATHTPSKLSHSHFPQAQVCLVPRKDDYLIPNMFAWIQDSPQLFTQCKNLLRVTLVWENYVSAKGRIVARCCDVLPTLYGSYVINFSYIYYDLSNWFSFLGGKHISKILDDVAFGEWRLGRTTQISMCAERLVQALMPE